MAEATMMTTDFGREFSALEAAGTFRSQNGVQDLRKRAMDRFVAVGLPTTREEQWRFTSVAPLAKSSFTTATAGAVAPIDKVDWPVLQSFAQNLIVFVNGFYNAELSRLQGLPAGVVIGSLASALESKQPAIQEHLARIANIEESPFTALNTALFQDGAFVYVPANTVISDPVHLLFLASSADAMIASHPRNLLVFGTHSQATLIETYVGPEGQAYFTNSVTEVYVEQDAVIDHYRYQQESRSAFHFAGLEVKQERTSNFSTQAITFGGGLVRNDIGFTLAGEGCLSTMNGLYQLGGKQHVDNHTRIDHAFPRCESHEFYKGILDDQARGVFNGSIMVRQIAQKTNAKQTNRNLLLSPTALINTNPQLEIFADDVKCTHGATIGQLDATQLYYLRSRGISEAEARRILTYAFANDIIERIKVEPLRAELERYVLATHHSSTGSNGAV